MAYTGCPATRVYLLGTSVVGITIVFTGLVPSEFTTFGIKFAQADKNSLLIILALVIAYFLAAFTIYGSSVFLGYRQNLSRNYAREDEERLNKERERLERRLVEARAAADKAPEVHSGRISAEDEEVKNLEEQLNSLERYEEELRYRASFPEGFILKARVDLAKVAFEFVLPVVVGLFAIAVLVIRVV